jgi:hypothetical protein
VTRHNSATIGSGRALRFSGLPNDTAGRRTPVSFWVVLALANRLNSTLVETIDMIQTIQRL